MNFTRASFVARTCWLFMVVATQAAAPAPRLATASPQTDKAEVRESGDAGVTATFPNGAVVELVGVARHPSMADKWWRPDGSPLDAPPYADLRSRTRNPQALLRELCWRWRHLPEGCVPSGCSLVPAASGYAGGRPRSAEAEPIPDLHAAAVSLRADIRSATVRFTIEAGDWLPLVIFDDVSAHATSQRFGDRNYGFILAEPLEVGGDVVITIAHDVSGMPLRVVAVDSDGQLRVAKMSGGGVNGRVFQITARFPDLKHRQIELLRFDTREYQTVEFRKVSLHRGERTKVEIVDASNQSL